MSGQSPMPGEEGQTVQLLPRYGLLHKTYPHIPSRPNILSTMDARADQARLDGRVYDSTTNDWKNAPMTDQKMVYRPNTRTSGMGLRRAKLGGKE